MADEVVDVSKLEAEAASVADRATRGELDGEAAAAVEESAEAVDAEIEDMKRRVREMEEEAAKLSEMQSEVESQMGHSMTSSLDDSGGSSASGNAQLAAQVEDTSIYIGQVDYGSTPEELQALFQSCGTINRVTILCDKFTGQPKGYAYIEFASRDAVESALLLNDTMFRGRQLKVTPKRMNVRGFNMSRESGRAGSRRDVTSRGCLVEVGWRDVGSTRY
uniref:RRM domain-containing protein n=1 Tax=Hyaloperonospora arabidopsidis (strain Emoy2) TaxID=559515 RepID=M4BK87_HYAAE